MKKWVGFTLIELIMVITLLGIIAAVVAPLLNLGANASILGANASDLDWKPRDALEKLSRELRAINPNAISTFSSNQLSFTDFSGNSVSFQLTGTTLLRNSNSLATNVSSFAFSYFDKNGNTAVAASSIRYILIAMIVSVNNTSSPLYYTSVVVRNGY